MQVKVTYLCTDDVIRSSTIEEWDEDSGELPVSRATRDAAALARAMGDILGSHPDIRRILKVENVTVGAKRTDW